MRRTLMSLPLISCSFLVWGCDQSPSSSDQITARPLPPAQSDPGESSPVTKASEPTAIPLPEPASEPTIPDFEVGEPTPIDFSEPSPTSKEAGTTAFFRNPPGPNTRGEKPPAFLTWPVSGMTASSDKRAKAAADRIDAEAETILAGKKSGSEPVNTVEFFANSEKYKTKQGERERIQKLFEDIRSSGATATHAVCTAGKEGDAKIAASYIVTLPEDKASRKKIIGHIRSFWASLGDDEANQIKNDMDQQAEIRKNRFMEIMWLFDEDRGQKYLLFNYDF